MPITLIAVVCVASIVCYVLGSLSGMAVMLWCFLNALKVNRLEIKPDGTIGPVVEHRDIWETVVWNVKNTPEGW